MPPLTHTQSDEEAGLRDYDKQLAHHISSGAKLPAAPTDASPGAVSTKKRKAPSDTPLTRSAAKRSTTSSEPAQAMAKRASTTHTASAPPARRASAVPARVRAPRRSGTVGSGPVGESVVPREPQMGVAGPQTLVHCCLSAVLLLLFAHAIHTGHIYTLPITYALAHAHAHTHYMHMHMRMRTPYTRGR